MAGATQRAARPEGERPQVEQAAPVAVSGPWPQGISREATMRISDVLAALGGEFPTISHSKLRFLEEQGLVSPVRTPAGYRKYSPADVERLRFVLRQQRDRYLPLKVIGELLADLDAGRAQQPVTPYLAAKDGEVARTSEPGPESPSQVAAALGVETSLVTGLVEAGVLETDADGRLDPAAREVVRLAAALGEHGIDARHLRSFRQAAERQVDVVEQVVAPLRSQRGSSARARAEAVATELGELLVQLHTTFVRSAVRRVGD